MALNNDFRDKLKKYGQEQLLHFENTLDEKQKEKLHGQLQAIDWEYMDSLIRDFVLQKRETEIPHDLQAPFIFRCIPENEKQAGYYREAVKEGVRLISGGKVAVLTVAGGQGTRLGYDGPKGKFPITPINGKPLFRYSAEKLVRAGRKYSTSLKWFIMTSDANDRETKEFFKENNYFGLKSSQVVFFTQGMMPAVDYSGKILMESEDSLALSPNGHGGTLLALRDCGCLDKMKADGVDHISYFQIDNPLVSPLNPLFIGLHCLENSDMSSMSLAKTGPYEKLGNFCISDGKMQIIEYSDMPAELAEKRKEDRRLLFEAGSPAIHIFRLDFIQRLTKDGKLKLPWHRADKKVAFVDEKGSLLKPEKPNAVKLETFIFDALPFAQNPMILEGKRELEFSPVKNPEGVDSVVSCRKMLIDKDAAMMEKAGVKIPRNADGAISCKIELSPLSFLDVEDVVEYFKTAKVPELEKGKEYYFE